MTLYFNFFIYLLVYGVNIIVIIMRPHAALYGNVSGSMLVVTTNNYE